MALNVALYGPNRWAMTERRSGALARDAGRLAIGPSSMTWDGRALTVAIDEIAFPRMTRIRGEVRVMPTALTGFEVALDPAGRHLWHPFAPVARIEVALERPRLHWTGEGYLDGNFGARPLEADFARWDWSRASLKDGAAVLYEAPLRDGGTSARALRFNRRGEAEPFDPPPLRHLGCGLWRVARETRSEGPARVVRRLEDAPFYTRELVSARLLGEDVVALHESLDCRRFANPLVRAMLPFRMPRV